MKNQIPIFVINLKKDTHKKEHMQNLLDKLGLKYEFIDAVYGKDLDTEYIKTVYDKEKAIESLGRELALGEIGCALSHKKVYNKMIKQDINISLILEDDVIIDKKILKFFKYIDELPNDGECFLINYYRNMDFKKHYAFFLKGRRKIGNGFKALRFVTQPMHSTAGYIITLDGAKKLNQRLEQGIFLPIDHYTGNEEFIKLYGITPRVIEIDPIIGLQSNIKPERTSKPHVETGINQEKNFKNFLKKIGLFTLFKKTNILRQKLQKELEYIIFNMVRIKEILKTPKKY